MRILLNGCGSLTHMLKEMNLCDVTVISLSFREEKAFGKGNVAVSTHTHTHTNPTSTESLVRGGKKSQTALLANFTAFWLRNIFLTT